jgi:serine/threonine protein kinase
VKLIDFGLGNEMKILQVGDEFCGTLPFMAPEVVGKK